MTESSTQRILQNCAMTSAWRKPASFTASLTTKRQRTYWLIWTKTSGKEFLELLPSETIAKRFVDYMDTDDAVDLMRELDEDKQEEILSHIEDIEQAGEHR